MNSLTMDKEKEIEVVRKKLQAMENLNRALSKERNDLIQVNTSQNCNQALSNKVKTILSRT